MSAPHDRSHRTESRRLSTGRRRADAHPRRVLPPRTSRRAPGQDHPRLEVALLVEDPITRAGVRAILGQERYLRILDEAAYPFPDRGTRTTASVLLVDASLASRARGALVRDVLARLPQATVLVFGDGQREEELFDVFDAGAAGYLLRGRLIDELTPALQAVAGGGRYIPAEVALRLREREKRPALTPREEDVLALLAEACSNVTIAAVLNISVGTVKLHVRAVLAKLGAEDRAEAAVLAHARGFVQRR